METLVKPKIHIAEELLIFEEIKETLAVPTPPSRRITWTSADGRETDIQQLEDGHLVNLLRWLQRKKLPRTRDIIMGEAERRVTQSYPPDFDEMVDEYKANPETWRLKIYEE